MFYYFVFSMLLLFSRNLSIFHPAQDNLDNEVDNLYATHYGEAGEETEGAADHRDLCHCICLGVLGVDAEFDEVD